MLNKQEYTTSCTKLSTYQKIAIQVPNTFTYPLFRVLSTITAASENKYLATKRKSRIKLEKVVIILKYISNSFLPTYLEPYLDFLTSIFRTIYRNSYPWVFF